MKRLWLAPLPLLLLLCFALLRPVAPGVSAAPAAEKDRSPSDLALSADGRRAVTANATSDTASLIDVANGKVIAEAPVGKRPFAVALSPDGRRALVTNWLSDSVTLLDVSPTALKAARTVAVGDEPRGVTFAADGSVAYVALAGEDTVGVIDLKTMTVKQRVPVGDEPWHVALTPDGKRLAVGCSRSRDVHVVDTATGKALHTVRTLGRNLRHIAVSSDSQWAYVPNISERGMPATKENIDNGWVVANRLNRVPLSEEGPREAIALDERGRAVGDLDGVALSPDGKTIAVTAGGTHELLLLGQPLPFIAYGGPDDHLDPQMRNNPRLLRRVPLGGRPLGVRFAPDGKTVLVANYLTNAVQVVDVAAAKVIRTIALGGPANASLARRGEAVFYDAHRSFNQWFSCNTCHVDGHTNGGNFDTFNDGSYGRPKKTLSLRGVASTGPWTWHGWQKELRGGIHESMMKSMQGPEPTPEDMDALLAYFQTIDFVPSPHRNPDGTLPAAAKRGELVFSAKGCNTCHAGPNFTSPGVYTVGLDSPRDAYKGFNPPSLRGVYDRAPYLHDGRAGTLEEVLTVHHRPSQLTGKSDLTTGELKDLIAYLMAL